MIKKFISMSTAVLLMASGISFIGVNTANAFDVWTSRTSVADNSWNSVAYGNGVWVAVAYSGSNRVMTSPDGITWTARTASSNYFWNSVAYGNGLFVAVGGGPALTDQVMTSPDGITWTSRTAASSKIWASVAYGNGLFVAVAAPMGAADQTSSVMTSPDGSTWTSRTAAENLDWASVSYGNGLWVAVASADNVSQPMSGGSANRVMTSTDGITWTARTSSSTNRWNSVAYGNGVWVAVASSGTNRVMTSTDGITWTARTAAANNGWNGVTYGDGLFVAVASTGTGNRVMTSSDGITWTSRTSAADNIWRSVAFGNSLFVAVASSGTNNRVMTAPSSSTPQNTAPGVPTIGTATATGSTTATVSYTAPASDGGSTVLSYTATSSPGGITATITQASSGTISVTGLSPATAYTFTVTALNSVGTSSASAASNSITTSAANTAPGAPASVVATATGKRTATVDFTAPASNGGSVVTSYTAISTPGGVTKTLTQAGGGTFSFDGLQPGTSYTFAVTATNANGTSPAATSSSVQTTAADVASLTSISFADDGSGTGGKLTWVGSKIDSVLYTGPTSSYPGQFTFGTFSSSWNGQINNLTPDTSYTISIYAISTDGLGASKSLTFKTGAKSVAVKDLAYWSTWLENNTYARGESTRLIRLLNNFNSLVVPTNRSYMRVPTSRVSKVVATSLTPNSCSVVSATAKTDAGLVQAITKDVCTISYTVSGPSKAPATMLKDFVFKRVG